MTKRIRKLWIAILLVLMAAAFAYANYSTPPEALPPPPEQHDSTTPPVKPKLVSTPDIQPENLRIVTETEKAKVVEIIKGDEKIKKMLSNTKWKLLHISSYISTDGKVGAVIGLDSPTWVETEVYIKKFDEMALAKLWTESINVKVNLTSGKVESIYPNLGRGEGDVFTDEKVEAGRKAALQYAAKFGKVNNSYLNAIYYIPNHYPEGIAFFRVFAEGKEFMVAVDLSSMEVVEEFTGEVKGIQHG